MRKTPVSQVPIPNSESMTLSNTQTPNIPHLSHPHKLTIAQLHSNTWPKPQDTGGKPAHAHRMTEDENGRAATTARAGVCLARAKAER